MAAGAQADDPMAIPGPPMLRPTWTTWAYIGLALIVAVGTVFGLWFATRPYPE
jgi:hypothetical protein